MKKTLLLALTLIITVQLFAQTKGQILLYGSLNGSYSKNQWGQKSASLRFAPGVGYNLTNRWTAGLMGSYGMDNYKDTGVVALERANSSWSIGIFGRYTKSLGEIFFLYGQLDLSYGRQNKGTVNGVQLPLSDATMLTAYVYPAVGVNLNNGFALNFAFGGLNFQSTTNDASPNPGQVINLNFGQAFQFGVSKFFGGYGRDALRNRYDY